MKTFSASRWSSGNSIYPVRIEIDDLGVTLKHPGLFSGKEKTVPFNSISSVDVQSPMVGFSTIIITTTGEGNILAHGFIREDVKQIKELILSNIYKKSNVE